MNLPLYWTKLETQYVGTSKASRKMLSLEDVSLSLSGSESSNSESVVETITDGHQSERKP